MEDRETAFTVYFFSGLLKYVKGWVLLYYQMMIYVSALRILHMRLKERASLRNGSLLI